MIGAGGRARRAQRQPSLDGVFVLLLVGWAGYHSNMSSNIGVRDATISDDEVHGDAPAQDDNRQPTDADGDDGRAGLDTGGIKSAIIGRLDAAAEALDDVDFADWSDAALSGHLDEVSVVLCRVDAQLSRLADAVRSRGFAIAEADLPLAS
jgi:hypothetical protein